MSTTSLASLFPYTVGFERLDKLFETLLEGGRDASYPPYNIVKTGEDAYRITMAVAGFNPDELEVVTQQNVLIVRGRTRRPEEEGVTYLYRGIGTRAFEHRFALADYVKVSGARLNNGMLEIDLVRELPEEMRPQKISITTGVQPQAIESRQAA